MGTCIYRSVYEKPTSRMEVRGVEALGVCVRVCFCLFCALSVFLWALVSKNSHLKLTCFVSVSSVLFQSSCGPWCQKTIILSWFALFLSLLCSFCLLVGLGVKKLSS